MGGGGTIFIRVYESGRQPLLDEDFLRDSETEVPGSPGQVCSTLFPRSVGSLSWLVLRETEVHVS